MASAPGPPALTQERTLRLWPLRPGHAQCAAWLGEGEKIDFEVWRNIRRVPFAPQGGEKVPEGRMRGGVPLVLVDAYFFRAAQTARINESLASSRLPTPYSKRAAMR